MVELVEVEDESFETKQVGPEENDDDYYTDTGSHNRPRRMLAFTNNKQIPRSLPMMKKFLKKRHW